jgi:hypothetical protein
MDAAAAAATVAEKEAAAVGDVQVGTPLQKRAIQANHIEQQAPTSTSKHLQTGSRQPAVKEQQTQQQTEQQTPAGHDSDCALR